MKKAGWASALVAVILLAVAVIAHAQQPKKVPRGRELSACGPLDVDSPLALYLRLSGGVLGSLTAVLFPLYPIATAQPFSLK